MAGWELPFIFEYGGLGVYGRHLIYAFTCLGYDVYWFGAVSQGIDLMDYSVEDVCDNGAKVRLIPVTYVTDLDRETVAYLRVSVVSALEQLVRYVKPDYMITHDMHVASGAEVGISSKVPTVHAIHTVSGDVYEYGVAFDVGRVVTNSRAMKASLETIFASMVPAVEPQPKPPKVEVIYPATPELLDSEVKPDYYRKRCGSRYVVGVFGRAGQWNKNYEVAIKAVRFLREEGYDVCLLMGGNGHAEVKGDCWVNVGYVPEEDKKAFYKALDVFILPSLFEPFGLVALEAVSAGVPTLLSKNSGVAEVLNAPTFDPKNPILLAEAIRNLLEGDKEGVLEKESRYVKERSWEDVAKEYIEVLDKNR